MGFWGCGFWGLGFWGLGFEGFRVFRVLGLRVLLVEALSAQSAAHHVAELLTHTSHTLNSSKGDYYGGDSVV